MKVTDYRKHKNELKTRFCCLRQRAPWELQPDRKILIGTPDKDIPNNRVETSKYNILTFLPKNSFEQFTKVSNLYFLLLGIFQILPSVTTTDGEPTVYLPLFFIMFVSMVKDFFEDFKRKRADEEENQKEVQRYSIRTGVFEYDKWQNLRVGDIIRIANKQRVPADIIILSTSKSSECFIETKNLDGETNLKPKYAHQQLNLIYKNLNEKELPYNLFVTMDFERQNPLMYKFKGSFTVINDQKVFQRESVNYENFIERGCSLQNTDWIVAVVVYTGHDTKIMMNSIRGKMKYSNVEIAMGKQIQWVFLILIVQCVFASLYYNIWYEQHKYDVQGYLQIDESSPESDIFYNFILRFAMWFLLLGNSVPISLLVTLETVKFFQAQLLQLDENYIYQDRHAAVHSSNLFEELGVIEYIFSDKTGTLTQNIMKFKSITINGIKYGQLYESNQNQSNDILLDEKLNFIQNQKIEQQNIDFIDSKLSQKIKQLIMKSNIDNNHDVTLLTFLCLSLCHTVQTEEIENNEIQYKASSPDEMALVSFAAEMGFKFMGKKDKQLYLYIQETKQTIIFELIQIFEFNSVRKRMSIILKDGQGKLLLFSKGADNILLSMLRDNDDIQEKNILFDTKRLLQEYATVGLRTLVLGYKELDQREYEKFVNEYTRATAILDDDQLRESLCTQLEENIESNLILLGATAVEDKLQDQVGQVISELKEAGINIWVLTGDKIETAINIGYSCKLLTENIRQFIIDGELETIVERQLNKILTYLESNEEQISLIVSGISLVIILHNFQSKFFQISLKAHAVMACRVSPKQKQEIVNLVRKQTGKITLSIGDGANDVAMITQAHVGIGIRGLEGQQASKASDYAIGEFKQLRRLLFYTGHESYRRNSNLILFNFYKNQIFTGIFFFYGFCNGFSAQNLYDQWLSQLFNVFYTSLPIMLYALFDEKYPSSDYLQLIQTKPNHLEQRPDIYQQYLIKPVFNLKSFWKWFFWGLFQGILIIILAFYAFEPMSPHTGGQTSEYLESGMTIMGAAVYIVNIRVIMLHNTNYPLLIYVNIGSSLTYILTFWIFSQYPFLESYDLIGRTFGCFNFYVSTLLMIIVTNFFDIGKIRYSQFKKNNKIPQSE